MSDFAKLILTADASGLLQGEQALDSIAAKGAQTEAKVTKAMRGVGDSGKQAARGLNDADAAAKRTAAGMAQAAQQAQRVAAETRTAAGQTANLTSQFNDIAVMMAAGQSPIQLALQQGTQITQVLAEMGGGVGAVKALGAAFIQMINPISLITIGAIAMGAALSQAVSGMLPSTKSFSDAMDELNDAIGQVRSNLDMFADGGKKLAEIYGGVSSEIRDLASAIAQIDMRKMNDAAGDAITALRSDYNGSGWGNVSRRESMHVGLGLSGGNLDRMAGLSSALDDKKPLEDNLAILTAMRETLVASVGEVGKMTSAQRDYYARIVEAEKAARQILDVTKETAEAEASLARAKISAGYAYAAEMMRQGAAMRADADQRISSLTTEAEIQRLVALYGSDSERASRARADAERDALEQTLIAKGYSADMADEVLRAYDATVDSANATADWATTMSSVRAEINAIASALASMGGGMISNAAKYVELNALKQGRSIRDAARDRQRFEMESEFNAREAGAGSWVERMLIRGERGVAERGLALDEDIDAARDVARERDRAAKKKGGSGRKKRSRPGRENEYERASWDIVAETESLLKQADAMAKVVAAGGDWERSLAIIEEEQKLLNEAQKAGVKINENVKKDIREMAEAYVDAEETLENMRTATEKGRDALQDFFGGILEGADGAKAALIRLLAQMAQVQFMNGMMGLLGMTSWGGAATAGIGKLLTPSFDGGGYTGSGSRSGGIDGKGGFPAILHPNETVVDHTKGQSLSSGQQSVHVTVGVDPDTGNLTAFVDERAGAAASAMGKAVSGSIPGRIKQFQRNPRKN